MPESPRSRLISLNQQAIAILRLGIPLDLGLGPNSIEQLRQVNDRLITDGTTDNSIDALLHRHAFPKRYESVARMLLLVNDPTPIFDSIALQENARESVANPLHQASAEPLVVAGLVYLGMIVLCAYTVPQIQSQYAQQDATPIGVTRLLIELKELMPLWIVGFPIAVLALWMLWRKLANGFLLDRFPGSRAHSRWLTAESQSKRLAVLVDSGVDAEAALTLAATSAIPVRPIAAALVRHSDSPSRPRSLKRLAQFYHCLATDRRQSIFFKAPALIGLLFAGLVVFGYALATFLPWIEILTHLGQRRSDL